MQEAREGQENTAYMDMLGEETDIASFAPSNIVGGQAFNESLSMPASLVEMSNPTDSFGQYGSSFGQIPALRSGQSLSSTVAELVDDLAFTAGNSTVSSGLDGEHENLDSLLSYNSMSSSSWDASGCQGGPLHPDQLGVVHSSRVQHESHTTASVNIWPNPMTIHCDQAVQPKTMAEIYRMVHAKFAPCGLFRINTPALPLIEGDPGWTSDHVPTLAELFTGSDWPLVDHVNRVCMMLTPSDRINRLTQKVVTHMFRRTFCDFMQIRAPPHVVTAINQAVFDVATDVYETYHHGFTTSAVTVFEVAVRTHLLWSERLGPLDAALADRVLSIQLVHRIVKYGPDWPTQCRISIAASEVGTHLHRVQEYVSGLPATGYVSRHKCRVVATAFMWSFLLDDELYSNKLLRSCMPLDAKQIASNKRSTRISEHMDVRLQLPPVLAAELITTLVLEFTKVCQRATRNPSQFGCARSMTAAAMLNKTLICIYLNHFRRIQGREELDPGSPHWYTTDVKNRGNKLLGLIRGYEWGSLSLDLVCRMGDLPGERTVISGAVMRAGVSAFRLPPEASGMIQRALLDARLLDPSDADLGQ
ncbi:hypothetical protein J8273_7514 [Carpediemonas membranifera]|uniref:Uncharacterized protein n=1 Tax=Carpediemonas membranifera TaxID=201153 RepID=A0A8J6E7Z3_9EUKA|nr:hypothetical protein J8273_7514 [Carpediemonas membranifera]|eukprot:KAG9391240.1 hypothetical protein J8273_7514 [Carpediemonas membranifera]